MIIHDCEQGTQEWLDARCGVITASTFNKIITPKNQEISKSAECIEHMIIAEILTGESAEEFQGNVWTDRGKILEPDAVGMYTLLREIEPVEVGFITNEDKTIGCSPDRLVGDDGLMEIKCPAPKTHVQYLVSKAVPDDYMPQIQGQMMVTGRTWVDFMSYHPKMPPSIIRVKRDEEYIKKLEDALAFVLDNIKTKIAAIKSN